MWVQCNYQGGITLCWPSDKGVANQLKFSEGPNEVDDDDYDQAVSHANQEWLKALMAPQGKSRVPMLEPCDAPAGATDEVEVLTAKDKIALVAEAKDLVDLELLADGEERKTVLAAIDKRADELADEE